MAKLIIVDGNSLLFRAYYATAYGDKQIMRTKTGIPTNAIFAFSNMMNTILDKIKKGDYLFVAFDTGHKTFRHEKLETYKANRKQVDEDLIKQFPIARDFLQSLNIFTFEKDGYEADDIAGSVAKLASKDNIDVQIYTSDKDYLQLIDDKIKINLIRKGMSDVVLMDEEKVKEQFGFEPIQIIDYKGLRGDPSDNLPGIPGVGDKTAVKLIQEYHDFDAIVEGVKNDKSKVSQNIIENQQLGRLCRDLAIIQTDMKLPFNLEELKYEGYHFKRINDFCNTYELKTFLNKINSKWKIEEENKLEYEIVKNIPNNIEDKVIGVSIDFEDEHSYYDSSIYGVGLYLDDKCLYIKWDDVLKDNNLIKLLEDENIKKCCYDFKSIRVALFKNNIDVKGCQFDILIASYLLDSSLVNEAEKAMNLFGLDLAKRAETISLFEDNNNYLRTVQLAYFSKKLEHKALNELSKISALELYEKLELPLITTLSDMEIEGFPLDIKTLDKYGEEFKRKLEDIQSQIYDLAGETFNISSPKQIAEILYDKLGLKGNKKNSTSVDALKEIIDEHPIVNKILEYRKYFKLITSYVDGLKAHIHKDGKIHATFNQALTQTGRLSSSNPNLQNISIRDEEGKMIRKAFFYPSYEYEILSLDYSQIELRVLSSLSKSESLKKIFIEHKDIHKETAKKIFKLEDEVDSKQRREAKTVNFGIIYGISDWGLSEELGISVNKAKKLKENFFSSYPELSTYFNKVEQDLEKNGYVTTLLGRRRYIREINDPNYQVKMFAKRAADNATIQGTAADLIKLAMIKCDKVLKENDLKTKIVLQIHDELIFKVPKNEKEIVYPLLKKEMENCLDLGVPLEVDGGFGKDWYDAK